MNPMWKVYKSKVMKTLNPDMEEDPVEEVCDVAEDITPIPSDEGPSAMTQLAKRMQGAGAKGWKSVSTLFTKDDEHQLLEAETQPAADHPLAVKPEEPPRPKRNTGFWDNFATKWHQAAAMRQAEATEAGGDGSQEVENESGARADEGDNQVGQEGEEGDGGAGNSFSKYATLGGGSEDTPAFKWNFVTSKLAELKTKKHGQEQLANRSSRELDKGYHSSDHRGHSASYEPYRTDVIAFHPFKSIDRDRHCGLL